MKFLRIILCVIGEVISLPFKVYTILVMLVKAIYWHINGTLTLAESWEAALIGFKQGAYLYKKIINTGKND